MRQIAKGWQLTHYDGTLGQMLDWLNLVLDQCIDDEIDQTCSESATYLADFGKEAVGINRANVESDIDQIEELIEERGRDFLCRML